MENVKYGTIVQVKKKVFEYYENPRYSEKNAPEWMTKHGGRAIVKFGPAKDSLGIKFWGITWEGTGQGLTISENDFEVVNKTKEVGCAYISCKNHIQGRDNSRFCTDDCQDSDFSPMDLYESLAAQMKN